MISATRLSTLVTLIDSGDTDRFYDWAEWKHVAAEVKRTDNNECQECKRRGRYKRGELVHHVKHLIDRPDLALSVYDPRTEERQLVTLCRDCHRLQHPEHMRQYTLKKEPLTRERWD